MIDFRLMQGGGPNGLEAALAGLNTSQRMKESNQNMEMNQQTMDMNDRAMANQDEADLIMQQLQTQMQDPEFNLASSAEFAELSRLAPDAAAASQNRFLALSEADQKRYKQDMMQARDLIIAGDIPGAQNFMQQRIMKLTKEGKRPDDSIRAFNIMNRDPQYFAQGVNQMLDSDRQMADRDVRFGGDKGDLKVGRFRSIDKGTAIEVMDTATGESVRTIQKSPTAKQEADAAIREQEAKAKKEAGIDKAFMDQDGLVLANQAAEIARDLAADDGLSAVVGGQTYLSMTPTFGASQSIINKAQNLMAILTKDNLGLMSGVLSESDLRLLGRISSGGLNVTEDGILGNYDTVVKQLNQIATDVSKSANGKQPQIDKRLFDGKQSAELGRVVAQKDVDRLRAAGFSTRQIYNMLRIE